MAEKVPWQDRINMMCLLFEQMERAGLKVPAGDRERIAALWVKLLEEQIDAKGLAIIVQAAKEYIRAPTNTFIRYPDFDAKVKELMAEDSRENYRRNLDAVIRRENAKQDAYIRAMTPEQRRAAEASWQRILAEKTANQ